MPGARQRLLRRPDRPDAHDLRLAAGDGDRADARQRLQPVRRWHNSADRPARPPRRRSAATRCRPSPCRRRGRPASAGQAFERWSRRGCSHPATTRSLAGSIGTISCVQPAFACAAAALRWLRTANSSCSARVIWSSVCATFSAVSPMRHVGGGYLLGELGMRHRVEAHHRHPGHAFDARARRTRRPRPIGSRRPPCGPPAWTSRRSG